MQGRAGQDRLRHGGRGIDAPLQLSECKQRSADPSVPVSSPWQPSTTFPPPAHSHSLCLAGVSYSFSHITSTCPRFSPLVSVFFLSLSPFLRLPSFISLFSPPTSNVLYDSSPQITSTFLSYPVKCRIPFSLSIPLSLTQFQ